MKRVLPEHRRIVNELFAGSGDGLVKDEGNGVWPIISILPDCHYIVCAAGERLVRAINDDLPPSRYVKLRYVRMSSGGMLYFPHLLSADGVNREPLITTDPSVAGCPEIEEISPDRRNALDALVSMLRDDADPTATRFRILPVDHYIVTADGRFIRLIHELLLERGMELRSARMPSGGTLYFAFVRHVPPSLDDMDAVA